MGKRRDEIVDLAEDCDRMANQLKVLVQAQQHLLHDISHELRSPLTRMQAAIGLLRQDAAPGNGHASSMNPNAWTP
jgi:signal transduction histidine kinase